MTSGSCGGNCRRGCGDQGGTARFELVRVALVSLILFLSGCSALLFQTLWLRLSGLAFGNSVWSAALILSSFMAGLALGSAIAARLSLRRVRPLRVYAGLEAIVAVFGCTLVFGLPGTGLTAACLSLAAAGIAWLFAGTEPTGTQATRLQFSFSKQTPWKLLLVSLGTGALFLGLEVIWFRFMRLYVASSSTAFCTMLAVVLAGIGLGGLAASAIPTATPRKIMPLLLLLVAMGTLLSYVFFPVPILQGDSKAFHIESWPEIARLSFALMFPVAFLSGILLPIIVSGVQDELKNRMNSTGLTILFNTVGAAVGPILACFVLLPWLGFQSSLILSAIAYAALALLTCDKQTWSLRRPGGIALILLGLCFLLLLTLFPYRRNETHFENARRPFEADQSVGKKREEEQKTK